MRILIGCPTSDYKEYSLKEYLEGIKNLTYKNFDLVLVDNSKNDYYFLLSLEQDVVPPKDVIERLLKHDKEITGALYFYLGDDNKTLLPMIWIHYEGEYAKRLMFNEIPEDKLIEVITCELGCI